MTEIQNIELDILKEIIIICENNNINYFLVCGSALGAAKYNGFIPWDDDIDVGMFRNDYERFLEIAPKQLPSHLFLQNYKSDKYYPLFFSKIRNSNTTFLQTSFNDIDMNHGVYVDVFPLDTYPKKKISQILLEKKKWLYAHEIACAWNTKRGRFGEILKQFFIFLGKKENVSKSIKKYEKTVAFYKGERGNIIVNFGNWQGKLEYAPKEQYGNGTLATFEGLKVRIPERYDEYLTQKYNDWRAELPPEQQVGHHYADIIDLNRPYTDYIEKLPNGKIRVKTKEEVEKTS